LRHQCATLNGEVAQTCRGGFSRLFPTTLTIVAIKWLPVWSGAAGHETTKKPPSLSAEELRHLAGSFREVAKRSRKMGELQQAERFERKAAEYEEKARKVLDRQKPKRK
jgi:hypothetical protein